MRVAALYDIHGNLPALEAVLADVDAAGVERIVCGGDVVAGPFPQECVERLLARNAEFVRGNADRELSDWVSGRLEEPARALLAGLPTTVSLDGVLYCHGSPRSDEEILTRLTPEPRLRECLVGVEESLVVCGHTHVQFDRLVDSTRVVNAGSVGIAYEGRQGAFWAVIEAPLVELRHTVYHVEAAVTAIRSSGYPDAEQLAQWLLEPVDPDETSSYFESIA